MPMPITETALQRLSSELSRLPRRRKTYSRKAALTALTDQIFILLRHGRSIDQIIWKLERTLSMPRASIMATLLESLQAERPDDNPETVLAEIIAEGQPVVDTTATPRGIGQSKTVTNALPIPNDANSTPPEQENVLQATAPTAGDQVRIEKRNI